jgi:chromosome partitioning protein
MIVDTDPQQTASEWAAHGEEAPGVVVAGKASTLKDVRSLLDAEVVVIDGAATVAELALAAVKASDLVLVPVKPSGADLWAAQGMLDVLRQRRRVTGGQPAGRFVVSAQNPQTTLAKSVDTTLSGLDLPVLDARTCHRVAYQKALGAGTSVLELGDRKAADEIRTLTLEVHRILHQEL